MTSVIFTITIICALSVFITGKNFYSKIKLAKKKLYIPIKSLDKLSLLYHLINLSSEALFMVT